jgi:cation diffusion facilitator CzcD-associated flavoprotein CzcO
VTIVIGAGPAGLAAAALLQRAGEQVVVFERDEIAAAWRSRYDRLQLHTVRWLSGLPDGPMSRSAGKWPSRDRVVEYLEEYAARQELDVRTDIEVTTLARGDGGWSVRTPSGAHEAKRVVVATGYSKVPLLPDWPGEFAGEIVHSVRYRNPGPFRGRRVLVVGAGNSGAEIAVDLAEGGAAEVLLSVRTPPAIVRRDLLGVPSQLLGIATPHLPVPVVDAIAATLRRISFPGLERYGLPAPARPYTEFLQRRVIPILDVGIVEAVRAGRVRVVAALEQFAGDAAVLADGAREPVDVVLAATGYRTGLEPLVGHLGVLDGHGVPVVHGADEHPRAPGLHFVGYQVVLGGSFRQAGIEARRLARAVEEGRSRVAPPSL